jgi:hypothetical protein
MSASLFTPARPRSRTKIFPSEWSVKSFSILQVKILPQKEPSGTGHVSLIVASSSIPQATPCRCRTTSVVPHHQTDASLKVSRSWLPPLKPFLLKRGLISARGIFCESTACNRSRGLVYTTLVSETRPSLSAMKWRPNLKRVTAAVIPVTADSGPPIRIPSMRVKRKRLPTRPKDHCASNMGRPQA